MWPGHCFVMLSDHRQRPCVTLVFRRKKYLSDNTHNINLLTNKMLDVMMEGRVSKCWLSRQPVGSSDTWSPSSHGLMVLMTVHDHHLVPGAIVSTPLHPSHHCTRLTVECKHFSHSCTQWLWNSYRWIKEVCSTVLLICEENLFWGCDVLEKEIKVSRLSPTELETNLFIGWSFTITGKALSPY